MMEAIVTVKLRRNQKHDPRNKITGECPLRTVVHLGLRGYPIKCTDITGSHHSYVERGIDEEEIRVKAEGKFGHVTRIEVLM